MKQKRKGNKGLFGKNGTVPLGDRFCCENDLPSVSKRQEKGHLYGGTGRDRCVQIAPKYHSNWREGGAIVSTNPLSRPCAKDKAKALN